ncbi:MAG: hypothetical protein EOO29_57230 [Comamonadaceae bacterium]|nr:MAG: hypothetical protein EOO29_57230 [Comamonadaceae bacterium]
MNPTPGHVAQELNQSATQLHDLVAAIERAASGSPEQAALRSQVEAEIVTMKRTLQKLRAALDGQDSP